MKRTYITPRRCLAAVMTAVVLVIAADARPVQEQPPAPAPTKRDSQPSSADVMKAFLEDRPVASPQPGRSTATPDGEPGGTARGDESTMIREGEYVSSRVGRLVAEGNWWMFVSEFDSSGEPPIRLLPNRQLERMVLETARGTVDVVYKVSGEVTAFETDNYLLVRKAMRVRTSGNLEK